VLEELKKLVQAAPFVLFTVELSSGRKVFVRRREHIIVGSKGLMVVKDDQGLFDIMPLLYVTALSAKDGSVSA
jgi:hypothetical protein